MRRSLRTATVLSASALNRALLARQMLLERTKLPVARADDRKRATLVLAPFETLARKDAEALVAEGRRLLAFAAPRAEKTEVRLGEAY